MANRRHLNQQTESSERFLGSCTFELESYDQICNTVSLHFQYKRFLSHQNFSTSGFSLPRVIQWDSSKDMQGWLSFH